LSYEEANVVDGKDSEVRQPHRSGHRSARQVHRIKLGKLGLDRGQAGIGSGDLKDARTFQQLSKARAGWNGRQIVGDQIGHIILTFAAVLSRLLSELSV